MNKGEKVRSFSILLLTLLGTLILLEAGNGLAQERVNFAVGFRWAPAYVLVEAAIRKNDLWKKQGLDVKWFGFLGGADMHRAIAAGAVDMGIEGVSGTLFALAGAAPVLIVARFEHEPNYSVWVLANSPLKEPKDMRGGRLGVFRVPSTTSAYGAVAIKGAGLAEKEVKFVGVGGQPERVAALKVGAIQAFVQTIQSNADLVAAKEVRALINVGDYLPKEWMEEVYVGRKEFLEKGPELVKRVLNAAFEAIEYTRANRSWAAEVLVNELRFSPAGAKLAVDEKYLLARVGRKINLNALENVVNFLAEHGLIKKEKLYPLGKFLYPNEFTR